jgi:hypothetical protein
MEVAARVGFYVWLRNIAQPETSALVHCGGFPNLPTTTFLVTCSVLCHGDDTYLLNNIRYLLFNLLEQIHDPEHHLDKKNCDQHFNSF